MNTRPRARALPPGHPIQVVARRTGLSADVIRAWEKRHGVVRPVRTASGRRLYSDADVERLRLLARATRAGRTVGQVAALPPDALAALVRDEAAGAELPNGAGDDAPPAAAHLRACLNAVARFDGGGLDATLRRAAIALSAHDFLDAVVVQLRERVADRVRQGTLRPAHQHLAQVVLRRVLDRLAEAALPGTGPELVVATPPGHTQELGALVTAAAAAAEGWRVVYLGPGLPAEDIAEAARHARARAVAVGLGGAPDDRAVPRELRRLRMLLPEDVALVVEGAAAGSSPAVLREIGAAVLRDVPALLGWLRALRESAARADGHAMRRGARAPCGRIARQRTPG